MATEVLLRGLSFGEGPRWHDGKLWFSDFYRHGIFTMDEDGTEEQVLEVMTQPSGLGWLPDGDLVFVSMLDRRLKRMAGDGSVSLHADLNAIAGGPCNDMAIAADGTAYVGNFGFDASVGESFRSATLAIVGADGAVFAGPSGLDFPNGTVITPDDGTVIVAESYGRRLKAYDRAADGSLSNERVWADLGDRVPDGTCLDAEGGVWVADPVNASCFRVIEGGEITDHIELELNCFACMLGGEDRRTLYLVTAPSSGAAAHKSANGRIESIRVDIAGAGLP